MVDLVGSAAVDIEGDAHLFKAVFDQGVVFIHHLLGG